jgi:hypothetical protein
MKTYVITTGVLFGLLTIAHIVRMFTENHELSMDPWYLAITALTAVFCVWAFTVLRRAPR